MELKVGTGKKILFECFVDYFKLGKVVLGSTDVDAGDDSPTYTAD